MRYFMDMEFVEDGKTIDLISIGIACEDGREYYAQSVEFAPKKASPWVKDHVLTQLKHCPHQGSYDLAKMLRQHKRGQCLDQQRGLLYRCPWRTRAQIAQDLKYFFNPSSHIMLWGWCCAYDWVAFCQLFGTMMDLPAGYPHHMGDIQQILDEHHITDNALPQQKDGLHTALADAKHLQTIWHFLEERCVTP